MASSSVRIPAFDGVRGLLAVGVVFSHVVALTALPWGPGPVHTPLQAAVWALGAPAVDTFFVLSGWVVALSFQRRPDFWPYLRARLRRLAPLGFLGVLLGLLVARPLAQALPDDLAPFGLLHALTLPLTAADWRGALSLGLGGWYDAERLNAPLWTLALELYASVLLPAMVALVGRIGWAAWPLSLPLSIGAGLLFWPLQLLPLFVLGVCLALRPLTLSPGRLVATGTLGLMVLLSRFVLPTDEHLYRWVSGLGAAGVLLAAQGLRPRLLLTPWAQWLGERSFALYITHLPVLVAAVWLLWPVVGVTRAALIGVPVSVLAAHLTHLWVDRPCSSPLHLARRTSAPGA
ncbi:acyltransferase family protein [Deinococcus multiflagellatus]|uniref:Acyltransferase family protein n=1 Tax=Deinococcus multiflagellatus TaxID=1656887 RepID=A0ABW1ZTJ6_9DEIO|nr:acyltransferase [Deinococcus multiflagellatus]MBZ9714489.1 acyltransferase [Deinococcus multiflagellatus]